MKKSLVLFVLTLLSTLTASVYGAYYINGLYYDLDKTAKTATVTKKSGSYGYTISGVKNIPSTVEYNGVTYSVTSIGDGAFKENSGLTSVTIPNSVTSIGEMAFYQCSSLTSVTIGDSVTSIGGDAFYGCSALSSINIPSSVTSIGYTAFWGCTKLTSVIIPNGVTSIEFSTFSGCKGLTSVTIPNSVTSIGEMAFEGCSGLASVSIPNSVTSIGKDAFHNCFALSSICCYAEDVPSTEGSIFYNSNIVSGTLYVPEASLEAYKATQPWNEFGNIKAIEDIKPTPLRGDVNGDGVVNMPDAMFIVNKILNGKFPDEE